MEGRVGYPARPFNFGGLPMGFCPVKRDPLQCFGIPGVENSGGEPRGKHSTIHPFAFLILRFFKKITLEKAERLNYNFSSPQNISLN